MTLRCILLGTGNIAGTYVRACRQVDGVAIGAVVSRSAERAAAYAREHDIPQHGDSLEAVAEHGDAVIVATPSGHHGRDGSRAARLGKHVLVEKPLDISAEAMDAVIASCREHDRRLGVCFQRRPHPVNRLVQRLLADGKLGRVLAVDCQIKFYRGQDYYDSAGWRGTWAEDGGGPFMQQGIHDLDLLCWMAGRPQEVSARCGTLAHDGIEVEDHGAAIGTLPEGGIVSIVASTIARPGFSARMDLITERGTVSLENNAIVCWEVDGLDRPFPAEGGSSGHDGATSAAVSDTSGHEAIIRDFAAAIAEGREPLVDGAQARQSVDLVQAIYRAAQCDGAVRVG